MNITERTKQEVRVLTAIGSPAIVPRFLLNTGRRYFAQPYDGIPMPPQQCYRNAASLALKSPDLTYTEGYMMRKGPALLVPHAWCVDRRNRVVDPTLFRPEECQYLGVEIGDAELLAELAGGWPEGVITNRTGLNLKFIVRRDPSLETLIRKYFHEFA